MPTATDPRRPLTDSEQRDYAEEHLDRWQAHMRRKYDEETAEEAGFALTKALQTYTGASPLESWIAFNMSNCARESLRSRYGRRGSSKHAVVNDTAIVPSDELGEVLTAKSELASADLVDHEETLKTLNRIDRYRGRVRLVLLARVLLDLDDRTIAHMLHTSTARVRESIGKRFSPATWTPTTQPNLLFDDLYQFIDAMMLFGCSIQPAGKSTPFFDLSVMRNYPRWTPLVWAVAMASLHGIRLQFRSLRRESQKLCFSSREVRFLGPTHARWYAGGERATPEDITLDYKTMIIWLVDALSKAKPGDPINCVAPRLSRVAAVRLMSQARRLGFNVELGSGAQYHTVRFPASERDNVIAAVSPYVPTQVWEC